MAYSADVTVTQLLLHWGDGDEQARRIVESIMNGPPADVPSQPEGRPERG